jgi:hypothetical protein
MISAYDFDIFDRCSRRFAFERTHEPRSIFPTGLLYAGIEGGLVAPDGAFDAIRALTARLDVQSGDLAPISAVRHIGFMAEVIALALTRKLGIVQKAKNVQFGTNEWRSNLFETRKGELHRIVLCSYLDDDSLRGFAHSWGTIGELAALERDMTLTAVVVGAQRAGRRHSHWTKCWQHPIQKSALRFSRRKGGKAEGFTDRWREVWRELTDISAATWLDKMVADDVLGDLIVSRRIPYRAEDARMMQARADMFTILPQMASASVDDPMRRSSCDEVGRGACPWQHVCWSPTPVAVEDLEHLYARRPSSSPRTPAEP